MPKQFPMFLRSLTLTGSIGGKPVHVMIRPPQGGATTPPPGNYDIHPPVHDPIYGLVALMVPAGGPSAPVSDKDWKVSPAANKLAPAMKINAPEGKIGVPAMWLKIAAESPSQGPQVFVISHNPIPGRNTVVISSGFADLMDALQAGGGATIKVT